MLPVATAPNAIVFQASTMRTSDMMKAGLPLNLICIITTNLAMPFGAQTIAVRHDLKRPKTTTPRRRETGGAYTEVVRIEQAAVKC